MQLVELITQAVSGLGYELVDFETSPRARLLRVFVDRLPGQGSVSIDDCTAVSNHLTRLFAVENVDYDRLEVSSPGLDRPLKKLADWQRYAGEDVQLKLRVPVGNQRNFGGQIVGLSGEQVVVKIEGEDRVFPLEGIEKARLVPKF
ncbi:MAG TPA: ribosome maturation factor RimP [Rhodocyclaceae bacterium]|nr:ribosome maturation factor RimP [Rhodocyclaceae bacterium]